MKEKLNGLLSERAKKTMAESGIQELYGKEVFRFLL